jgi:hypothetical protein
MAALAVIYWGKPVPPYVEAVQAPIMYALLKCGVSGRVEYVNRKMGQMKRRRPNDFEKLASWLQIPANRSDMLRAGHPELGIAWLIALTKFKNGTKFSTAFNSRGRTRPWKFGCAHLRAVRAKYLHQKNEDLTLDEAVGLVTDFGQHDEREIRRAMLSTPDTLIDEGFFPRGDDNEGI